ncbi:MAG: hypothetical protein WC581_03370 [Thermodesulfovibrionales bacterium]
MAQGKICPACGYYMYAAVEEEEPGGRWIFYECRNEQCKFSEKVYEETEITYHPLEKNQIIK